MTVEGSSCMGGIKWHLYRHRRVSVVNSGNLRTCQQCSSLLQWTPASHGKLSSCSGHCSQIIHGHARKLPHQPGQPQCCCSQSTCHNQFHVLVHKRWVHTLACRAGCGRVACMANGQGAHLGFAASYKGLGRGVCTGWLGDGGPPERLPPPRESMSYLRNRDGSFGAHQTGCSARRSGPQRTWLSMGTRWERAQAFAGVIKQSMSFCIDVLAVMGGVRCSRRTQCMCARAFPWNRTLHTGGNLDV